MKISIIVPIYKVPEKFLRHCIDSLLEQTYDNVEVILVDDGSPDNCGEICDEYKEKNEKIKVVHKNNGGLSSARNAGVLNATGEYIMFVDGDDWLEADCCKILSDHIDDTNVDLLMFGMAKDYEDRSIPYKYFLEENHKYCGEEMEWLQTQVLNYKSNIATATTKLIRKRILIDNNLFHDEELRQGAEGIVFNLYLFEKIASAMFVNRSFYHYSYNDISISSTHSEINHKYVVSCFERINEYIEKSSNRNTLKEWLNNRLLYVVVTTAVSGYFSPDNKESFKEKKSKFLLYLDQPIIKEALLSNNIRYFDRKRKIVIFCVKKRLFLCLELMGNLRKWQKSHM